MEQPWLGQSHSSGLRVWFCKPQGTPKPHLYPGSISPAPKNHLFIRRTKQEGETAVLLPLAGPVSGAGRDVSR